MTATTTVAAGQRFGHWHVLAIDATGRRAGCRCRCGVVREVSVASLVSGESTSCGCQPLTFPQRDELKTEAARRQLGRDLKWRRGDR